MKATLLFNFCNNNSTAWFGPELPAVGEAAKWIIEPVGESSNNYFGVTTADKMKGKNNKLLYNPSYTDFPMKIIDNINAYVVESVGTMAKKKDIAKCTKIASTRRNNSCTNSNYIRIRNNSK